MAGSEERRLYAAKEILRSQWGISLGIPARPEGRRMIYLNGREAIDVPASPHIFFAKRVDLDSLDPKQPNRVSLNDVMVWLLMLFLVKKNAGYFWAPERMLKILHKDMTE